MKVLVIRFSSIGDIVLTTPVVRCLRKQLPGVQIHYLTKVAYGSLLAQNPNIDRLWYLHDNLEEVIDNLKKEKFDCVIDLHNNLRTLKVRRALKVKKTWAFPKLNIRKWIYTNLKVNLMPDASIVERYFEAVRPLGVKNDGLGLDQFIPPQQLSNRDIPMSHWGGYVGCVIGASLNTKKLPVAQWQAFCKLSPYPIMLLGGPEDREAGNEIAAADPIKVYNSCGKFNLTESAELVKMAKVVVANDTGLMHMAAAFQKPVVSLWGNTTPGLGMFPYYGQNNAYSRPSPLSVIMENNAVGCRPCSKIGFDKCPKGHFRCMNGLDMTQVNQAVEMLWKEHINNKKQ